MSPPGYRGSASRAWIHPFAASGESSPWPAKRPAAFAMLSLWRNNQIAHGAAVTSHAPDTFRAVHRMPTYIR